MDRKESLESREPGGELASKNHDVFCLTASLKGIIIARADVASGVFLVGLGGRP